MAGTEAYNNVYSMIPLTEKYSSTGTGTFSTTKKYISGSIDVFIDGTITDRAKITETSEKTFTVSPAPRTGSTVIIKYNPLS